MEKLYSSTRASLDINVNADTSCLRELTTRAQFYEIPKFQTITWELRISEFITATVVVEIVLKAGAVW